MFSGEQLKRSPHLTVNQPTQHQQTSRHSGDQAGKIIDVRVRG